MKKNKIIAGAMALMVMACAAPATAVAAGGTVVFSASKETALPGDEFTIEVSLSDIPSTGINACEFAVGYDSSLVTITGVEAGALTKTNAESVDASSSSIPLFDSYINKSNDTINVCWSTSAEDSKYWMQGEGVMVTITGTVNSDAKNGSVADFEIEAISRDTYPGSGTKNNTIKVGYYDGTKVMYDYKVENGSVTIGSATPTASKYGDANCDGDVNISDVVLVKSWLLNSNKYSMSEQGKANADVQGSANGINGNDVVAIQKYVLQLVDKLPI